MKFYTNKYNTLKVRGRWPTSTLGATIVSIQKWIVAKRLKPSRGLGSYTCGLCKIYVAENAECNGCPIMNVTGKSNCNFTPWYDAKEEIHGDEIADSYPYHINREIRFLTSLLPGLGWLRWSMKQEDGSYK